MAAGIGKMSTPAWMKVLILIAGLTSVACEKSNEEVVLEEKAESWNLVVVVTLLAVCIFATYLVVSSKIRQVQTSQQTGSLDPRRPESTCHVWRAGWHLLSNIRRAFQQDTQ